MAFSFYKFERVMVVVCSGGMVVEHRNTLLMLMLRFPYFQSHPALTSLVNNHDNNDSGMFTVTVAIMIVENR